MISEEQQREHAPKETLYIQNINEKIKAKGKFFFKLDVKYALFNLFEAFGQVLQIVCKRNDKMRGQAFVVFREVGEATAAKNNLNGYPIFGKPMVDIELTLENTIRSQTQQNSLLRRKMMMHTPCIIPYYQHTHIPYYCTQRSAKTHKLAIIWVHFGIEVPFVLLIIISIK